MMNAGVAKLIPQELAYSRTAPKVAHVCSEEATQKIAHDRATKHSIQRCHGFGVIATHNPRGATEQGYRTAPSPLSANGAHIAG
ncbi:hypothetical protein QA641_04810 [Bradyrhizobium sp. CB1650]|uniref:hypothetical protein n=1 Tax=Bradyrhizobium sp. CB1650 TaxID=3039153 RepID=UPI0024350A01|nr:hypothetical protein [Bradyrhizobium sp. CB1650]WGD56912.1 hypothetical protein QA641_04810 [Bradyrhizobium sp. CB1650]